MGDSKPTGRAESEAEKGQVWNEGGQKKRNGGETKGNGSYTSGGKLKLG